MITSQITARAVFGQNPIGFVPLVPLNNGYLQFNQTVTLKIEVPYSALTFVANDIPATQANFLTLVQDEITDNYLPSVFSDATKTYDSEIQVNAVRLDFKTSVTDRGIWTSRTYVYFVDLTVLTNVI
jgi:hypothetical protein